MKKIEKISTICTYDDGNTMQIDFTDYMDFLHQHHLLMFRVLENLKSSDETVRMKDIKITFKYS